MIEPDTLKALRRNPLFASLAPHDRDRILADAEKREVAAGDTLFRQGEKADRFFVVVSGQVQLFVDASKGRYGILDLLGAGDMIGEEAFLDRGEHIVSARALQPCTVIAIHGEAFFRHLEHRFDLVRGTLASVSARLRALVHEVAELKLKSTPERLGGFLLTLAEHNVGAGPTEGRAIVRLPFDKHLLAEKLGMKPESLSRAFAKLRGFGVRTEGHNRVIIDELAGLRRFCQGEAA